MGCKIYYDIIISFERQENSSIITKKVKVYYRQSENPMLPPKCLLLVGLPSTEHVQAYETQTETRIIIGLLGDFRKLLN